MSSLARQLAGIASLDAGRLTSRTGAPSSKSYLFSAKAAAEHDLDAIFSLAQAGFDELVQVDTDMEPFEERLFSESARRTDRMMLSKEENAELDEVLNRCLRRLGKWIGTMAGGKCIEWLVRRFRIHEFNIETTLQVFLPYHESPNFARMLAILTIPQTSPWFAAFHPLIKNAQPVPRSYIATAISPAKEPSLRLLSAVIGSVKLAMKEQTVHRALLAFWTSTIVEMLERNVAATGPAEGFVKLLVEAFVEIMSSSSGGQDVNAAVYPPLLLLARSVRLADGPFAALVSALTNPEAGANTSQRLLTLLVVLNDRPDWTGGLGDNAAEKLSKIALLGETVKAAMDKYGFEAAVSVVVEALCQRPDLNRHALDTLLGSKNIAIPIARSASAALLLAGSSASCAEETRAACKDLISALRERYPSVVDAAYTESSKRSKLDSSLLVGAVGTDSDLANLYSADVQSRIQGLKALASENGNADPATVRSAIIARLGDQDASVVSTVYEALSSQVVELAGTEFIAAVRPAFVATKPSADVIRLHLEFIASSEASTLQISARGVFEQLAFPCLLPSAGREALDSEAWELLAAAPFHAGFGAFKPTVLEAGKLTKAYPASGNSDKERRAAYVYMLVRSLSEGIQKSKDAKSIIHDFLLPQLESPHSRSFLLAHMLLAQLILSTRNNQQIELAHAALVTLEPSLKASKFKDIEEPTDILPASLVAAALLHPEKARTRERAIVSVFTALAKVVKPANVTVPWLLEVESSEAADSATRQYASVARRVYGLCHSNVFPSELASLMLRSLFIQLGEQSLLFLASTWASTRSSTGIKLAALRHALAFIRAHAEDGEVKDVDFQIMVPALLVALQDAERSVREAAITVLKAIAAGRPGGGDIYALDTAYGHRSDTVQLLKPADLQQYLQILVTGISEIVLDAGSVKKLHSSELSMAHGRGRKETQHRRAILGSLFSHIQAWNALGPRVLLLSSLSGVSDTAPFRGVLPILSPLLDAGSEETVSLATRSATERETYLSLLAGTLTKAAVPTFADEDGRAWDSVLSSLSAEGQIAGAVRRLVLQRMSTEVFAALSPNLQIAFVAAVVRSLHDLDTDEVFASRAVLQHLTLDAVSLISLLEELAQPLDTGAGKKKQKSDESRESEKVDRAVADLAHLVETRTWSAIPGSAPLVACFMAILSTLLSKRQSIKEGADYLEQEMLGAILAQVEQIKDAGEVKKAHVGIEVIVKVIRASTNPRTSQRALLVASELARLIPDAVLHNVMPIFTFMGASDFQRDDAYSFGVVEKTVSRIVPVVTKSLKERATDKLSLYRESASLLRIFTDMVGRLPKHRTLPFFVHLIRSLGAADFLAPVCMLLVDRTTSRSGKSGTAQAIELALGIAGSFDVASRLEALRELVLEAARLVADLPSETKEAFLSQSLAEGEDSDRALRQITTLLNFATGVGRNLSNKACDQSALKDIIRQLVALVAKTSTAALATSDLAQTAQTTLAACMALLSAETFLFVTKDVLEDKDGKNTVIALDIVASRLPLVKKEVRSSSGTIMAAIIRATAGNLSGSTLENRAATAALRTIVTTALPYEDTALAQVVPKLIQAAKLPKETARVNEILAVLELFIRHLATRVIPFVQSILDATLEISVRGGVSPTTVNSAFSVITSIVDSVPTFIGSKQLSAVLRAAFTLRAWDEESSNRVLAVVARKVPTKSLFAVVMDEWKHAQSADETTMESFFHLLRLTLKNADRKVLPGMVKQIFAFFLDVFDLRHRLQEQDTGADVIDRIEESAIGSFLELVTKLNESTFKPLFVRLYDWAVIDLAHGKAIDDGRLTERKTVLLHVVLGLLQKFRHLLSPYIGILLPHIEELLPAYEKGDIDDVPLWTLLMRVLAKSFEVDDGAFWTEQSLLKLTPLLVAQVPVFPEEASQTGSALAGTLASLAASTTSEPLLKLLNTRLCLVTRDDEPKVRIAALRCMDSVWEKQAEEMISFVPETVSEFLAELLEDENADVEAVARGVLARIERMTGSLQEYLE